MADKETSAPVNETQEEPSENITPEAPAPDAEASPVQGEVSPEATEGLSDPEAAAPSSTDGETPDAPLPPSDEGGGSPQGETEGETSPAPLPPSDEGGGSPQGETEGETSPAPEAPAPEAPEKEKKPLFRRIVGIVGYTVIIALMAVIAFVMFSNMSGKATFIFGKTAMWVKTQSMSPEIPEKSYILVRQATASEVKVGDIIVFISSDPSIAGSYNTHRVLEISENGEFVTKGDNNLVADQYTAKPQNIIGIYERNLPVMTAFGRVMSTTLGIMITFTMIFVIFLIIYVPDMIKISKRRTEEAARIEKARVDALVALEVAKLQAAEAAKKVAEAKAALEKKEAEKKKAQ